MPIYFSAPRSDVKIQFGVNVANFEQCSSVYQSMGIHLSNNTLCAGGDEGRDSCSGDSGDQ